MINKVLKHNFIKIIGLSVTYTKLERISLRLKIFTQIFFLKCDEICGNLFNTGQKNIEGRRCRYSAKNKKCL